MNKTFHVLTAIVLFAAGLTTANTFFSFLTDRVYAAEPDLSSDVQNTGDNQTDNSNDNGGNSVQGLAGDNSGDSHNNKDKKAPSITSVKPNFGTSDIPIDTTVEVTFSEPVRASTVTDSTFKLTNAADNSAVLSSVSLNDDGTIATITPSSPLSASTAYNAKVSTGVKDLAGNRIVSEENWSFTTGEAGSATTTSPTADSGLDTTSSDVTNNEKAAPIVQSIEDDKLIERIFPKLYPLMLQKLDGATILEKVDATQLLQKVDGQALLEKVLPYMDIKLVVRTQDGQKFHVKVGSSPASINTATSSAVCSPDEAVTGGGFNMDGAGVAPFISSPRNNGWFLAADSDHDYSLQANVQCVKAEVGVKPTAP